MSNGVPFDFMKAIHGQLGTASTDPAAAPAPAPAPQGDFMAQVHDQFSGATTAPKVNPYDAPIPEAPGTIARPVVAAPPEPVAAVAPAGPPAPPEGAAPTPQTEPAQPEQRFVQVSGGHSAPAHDVQTKSAATMAGYEQAHQAAEQGVQDSAMRAREDEARIAATYEQQARHQMAQADAQEVAGVKRAQELDAVRSDIDTTSQQLAKTKIDPKRAFKNMSGGEKALSIFSVLLGGVASGLAGTKNVALAQFEKQMDRDIKAQEFAYQAGMDRLGAQKSDYAMAMQKYGQEDAAASMSRLSYLDAAKMQVEQAMTHAKGSDKLDHLQDVHAQILEKRAKVHDAATKYVQASRSGPTYLDTRYGDVVSREKANARKGHEGELAYKNMLAITKGTALESAKAQAKVEAEGAKDLTARTFVAPDGRAVVARTPAEAQDLSKAAASVRKVQGMVQRASKLREKRLSTLNPLEQRRIAAELKSIQSDMVTEYGVQHQMGALSGPDMELAVGGVGNIASWAPGSDAGTREYMRTVYRGWNTRLASLPGAPANTAGAAPEASRKVASWSGGKK